MKLTAISSPALKRQARQPSPGAEDRWLAAPALVTTATVTGIVLLCGLPGLLSFILIPLSLLGFLIGAVGLGLAAIVLVAKRRLRKAASLVLAVALPILLWGPINTATEMIHLGLTVGSHALRRGSPPSEDRQFAVYDWSVGLVGGPNTFLVHDVTDEIALPMEKRRYPAAYYRGFSQDCAGRVRRLLGHYYICTL